MSIARPPRPRLLAARITFAFAAVTFACGGGSSGTPDASAGAGASLDPAGPGPSFDPTGALPRPSAPVAPGSWVDRTPCPAPRAAPDRPWDLRTTHDGRGVLHALGTASNSEGVADLWTWDADLGHFRLVTDCRPPASWPTLQSRRAFGHDPERDRLVVAGEPVRDGRFKLWERAPGPSGAWTVLHEGLVSMELDHATALAHDPARRSLVLTGPFPEEWRARDGTWGRLYSSGGTGPYPHERGATAYDERRSAILLLSPAEGRLQMWEYAVQAQRWTDRSSPNAPRATPDPILWWSAKTGRAGALVGGTTEQEPAAVWDFDPATGAWSPQPRAAGSGAPEGWFGGASYDRTRDRLVTWFGGPGRRRPGLWAWDPTARAWSELSPKRWPKLWPGARGVTRAVYDGDRGRLVVVTADENGPAFDVLDWDGEAAAFVDRRRGDEAVWPDGWSSLAVTYDRHRRRLVAYGRSPARSGVLWEWDPHSGVWQERARLAVGDWPDVDPGSLVYDSRRRRVLLWGTSLLGGLWEWDPATNRWQPQRTPAAVAGAGDGGGALVYDERRGRTVLLTSGPTVAEWDGASWTMPRRLVDERLDAHVVGAWDPRSGRVIVAALSHRKGSPHHLFSWDGERAVDVTSEAFRTMPIDADRDDVALVSDWRRGNLMLVAPTISDRPHDLPWELHVWEGQPAAER